MKQTRIASCTVFFLGYNVILLFLIVISKQTKQNKTKQNKKERKKIPKQCNVVKHQLLVKKFQQKKKQENDLNIDTNSFEINHHMKKESVEKKLSH
ncbi:hypothetical protein RFI_02845 [Reticulomyxa filosa]|uniref:Transmembrane protein n=1 Tax=Reticulomyxa filosa TaxID=46433 RepID=X6P6S9_RETFI|nr:hypothetical protein RFI_02845 [Reticulomyxa filosa]|eukprot:ETO34250.1 hypothetical protein RFI_02845 [Reticulomyxa filosa]